MSFLETVERARNSLERNRRVSLQGLKREFDLDDEALDGLVSELVDVQQVAALDGKVLSWIGSAREEAPVGLEADVASAAARREHRQLTVMFCDLVGSTALSERLDTEDLDDVMRAYQESSAQVIARYEGHIGQYLGDGLLVYFGYPRAHEDDAERAVRAGLALLRDLDSLNERLEPEAGVRLVVRIGVHTGAVLVGEVGKGADRETQMLGATTNIAARLMSVAEPGSLVISGATLRLIPGRFRTRDLGTPALKGITEAIRAFAVLHPTGIRTRLDVDPKRLTPLVGRDRELGLFLDCWDRARKGERNAVLLSGEAGVGKSRLLRALNERLADEPHSWIECQCARYTQGSAFSPLIELIERSVGFEGGDPPESKLPRLEVAVERAGLSVPEVVPLLTSVLSLKTPERYPPLEFSPDLQHKKTIEALGTWILALAEGRPLVLLVEDLQWGDPSTLELLTLLIERHADAPLLILLTFRADFEPPWPVRSDLRHLIVSRLGTRQAEQLVKGMARDRPLSREVRRQIVERADGVPLFLEELTKMVLESGPVESSEKPRQPRPLAIPSTLQDLLMARLDRLNGGKKVAQLGAVLGRQFSYQLLRAVSRAGDAELAKGLQALIDAELLLAKGTPPRATYKFSHALIQETAYHSLLRSERRRVEAETADALVERFPERAAAEPEVVARLYHQAGLAEQAIAYYRRAARRASRQSASEEAIAHLRRALEILETLPERAERDRLELELQLSIGVPLYITRGWANAEYGQRLERACALATQVGAKTELLQVWMGLYTHHQVAGRLASAEECARRALQLVDPAPEHRDHQSAQAGLSLTLYLQGKFVPALEHLEQAVTPVEGVGGVLVAHNVRALCRWTLGYPDRALALCKTALASAEKTGPPFALASAYIYSGWIHQKRGEHAAALGRAQEGIDLCERLGFSWLPWAIALRASVRAEGGERNATDIQAGIDSLKSAGTKGWVPHCYGALAEALWKQERHADALGALACGLECAEETGQHYEDAELLRLRGEILLADGGRETSAAEQALGAALETARRQEAKSLELRAATSLARLRQRQGRNPQAHALLAPVHHWFSEGFDTRDWQEAKTLLEELA